MPHDWDDGLSVGVEQIDVEHRQILRRVRQLVAAVAAGRSAEIRSSLRFLQAYLAEHFAAEEGWMTEAGYPGFHEHARLHAALLDRVALARARVIGSQSEVERAAADLAETLDAHMRTDDLRLGRFLTARENFRRLGEAGPGAGPALTPIPTPRPR